MTTRRQLLIALGAGVAAPLGSFAQQPGKIWRVGVLQASSGTQARSDYAQFLRELGYVEGKNLVIELRHADGELKRLPALAAELIQLNVDAIISAGTPATIAAKQATTMIPIVMVNVADPVETCLRITSSSSWRLP